MDIPKKLKFSPPVDIFFNKTRTTNGVNKLKNAHWIPYKLPMNKSRPCAFIIVRITDGYFLLLQQQHKKLVIHECFFVLFI